MPVPLKSKQGSHIHFPTFCGKKMAELVSWAASPPQKQYSESAYDKENRDMCKRKTLDLCNVPSNPALLLRG